MIRQASEARSWAELIEWCWRARRVTFRRYGPNGEYHRPMVHRFAVKAGVTLMSVMAGNVILSSNPLLDRLRQKGK